MKYMLDTNICIYLIREKSIKMLNRLRKIDTNDICISSITLSELEYGIQKSNFPERNKLALTEFLVPLTILPYDDVAASEYGKIRNYLEKEGKIIGAMDLLIGAHALSLNLTLVTNNMKEFERIRKLKLENWV